MIKVQDKQTGEVKQLPDDSRLPALVESGTVAIPDMDYEFSSPEGEKFIVGAKGFAEAIKQGWKYRDQNIKEDEKLEAKFGNSPGKALALATARGLSLGLSDVALEKSGLVEEETLRELQNRNPVASGVGEVGATIVPALLSGGTSLLAKASAKTLPGMIAKLATKQGARAAQNITSEVAKKMLQYGVEGAIEGAAAGIGQTVSEAELGDAEFNAETLLTNIGTGALIGGGFGSTIGGASHYVDKATKSARKKVVSKFIDQVDGDDALKAEVRAKLNNDEAMEEGLLALKDPEIQAIKAKYPDAPISEGMESALKPLKNVENYLYDAPTAQGEAIRRKSAEISEYVDKAVNDIWNGAREASPEETGDLIRQTFFSKINEPWESGKAFYSDFMNEFGGAPVSDRYRTELSNIIKNSDAYRIGGEGADIKRVLGIIDDKKELLARHSDELQGLGLNKRQIKELNQNGVTAKLNKEFNEAGINLKAFNDTVARHANELPKRELTLQQIKELQSDIGASIKTSKGSERKLLRETYDRLRSMQDSIIRETVGTGKSADKIIKALDAANADYVSAYKAKDEIADLFGIKGADLDTVLEKLENMSAIDLDERFLRIKKSDKAMKILEKYPEVGKLVLANRQNQLLKKHIVNGGISYSGLKKDLLKMTPEQRAIYFGGNKNQERRMIDMLTLYEKRPKTLNPSGTDIRKELREMLSPKSMAENWMLGEIYKGNKSVVGKLVNKVVPNLAGIEQSANRTKNKIASSVNGFFKASSLGVAAGTLEALSDNDLNKARKNYEMVQGNPDLILERFTRSNRDLIESAPETANALQQRIIAGVQFLQSKTPHRDQDYLGEKLEPSRSELLKFNDYVEAVEKPQIVYEQLKSGYLNPNTLETLRVVYPKIYSSIQAELISKLPKKLTRAQKIQLQPILGSKVTPAMDYQNLMRLQSKTNGSAQANQQVSNEVNRVPASIAKNMKLADRSKTGLDKVLNRP